MNFYFGENALYFPQVIRDKYSEVFTKGIQKPIVAIGMMDEIDTFQKLKPEHRTYLREMIFGKSGLSPISRASGFWGSTTAGNLS
jgi:hypothetical protein